MPVYPAHDKALQTPSFRLPGLQSEQRAPGHWIQEALRAQVLALDRLLTAEDPAQCQGVLLYHCSCQASRLPELCLLFR